MKIQNPIIVDEMKFSAVSTSNVAINSIFLDSSDNVFKKKNNDGEVSLLGGGAEQYTNGAQMNLDTATVLANVNSQNVYVSDETQTRGFLNENNTNYFYPLYDDYPTTTADSDKFVPTYARSGTLNSSSTSFVNVVNTRVLATYSGLTKNAFAGSLSARCGINQNLKQSVNTFLRGKCSITMQNSSSGGSGSFRIYISQTPNTFTSLIYSVATTVTNSIIERAPTIETIYDSTLQRLFWWIEASSSFTSGSIDVSGWSEIYVVGYGHVPWSDAGNDMSVFARVSWYPITYMQEGISSTSQMVNQIASGLAGNATNYISGVLGNNLNGASYFVSADGGITYETIGTQQFQNHVFNVPGKDVLAKTTINFTPANGTFITSGVSTYAIDIQNIPRIDRIIGLYKEE